ncbi:MAG TPA: hypothetical protein VFJ94_12115 [Intrasporangium sp.]|uniref:hypothetical protein n=1 Tax=Intrasporangium sp. TaxID=1925024 RepID=UPI002D77A1D8|nr:hypothetical protein [Intrasporangium sp.]HET7399253.1 hypothetical protein [Intrasporangium sp.]
MTTTPDPPAADEDQPPESTSPSSEEVGVEVGRSEGEGSTFEPEEDPEGQR